VVVLTRIQVTATGLVPDGCEGWYVEMDKEGGYCTGEVTDSSRLQLLLAEQLHGYPP